MTKKTTNKAPVFLSIIHSFMTKRALDDVWWAALLCKIPTCVSLDVYQ